MNRTQVLQLLAQHKTELARRFGSTVPNVARPDSDVDVMIAFDGPATSARHGRLKLALQMDFLTTGPVNHEHEEDADRLTHYSQKGSKPHQHCLSTTSDYWIFAPKLMGSSLNDHDIPNNFEFASIFSLPSRWRQGWRRRIKIE